MTALDRYAPRWRRIEQSLRERVARLEPGDALPSDAALCREFGVSRMTARNAMQRLADDGLVVRHPGRGSFVATPPAHRRADRLLSFSHEMERLGRVPSSRVLRRELRPASRDEAALLGLAAGEPVFVLGRVRCADGEPVALETAVLAGATAPTLGAADLERDSLHEVLAAAGFQLRRGSATIGAAAATADDSRFLSIRPGDPVLVERRVILDIHGTRVEATESRYRADRYALDVRFDVETAKAAAVPTGHEPQR